MNDKTKWKIIYQSFQFFEKLWQLAHTAGSQAPLAPRAEAFA